MAEKTEKAERTEKAKKAGDADKAGEAERSGRAEKEEKAGKAERADKAGEAEKLSAGPAGSAVRFARTPGLIGFEDYRKYAVMVPAVLENGGLSLLFEVRAKHLGTQPGEVCFPGGRLEGMETPAEAAVRETCEELLVSRESVELITQGDIFLHPAGMAVYPFLGVLKDYENTCSRDEVDRVFKVPLKWLMEQRAESYRVSVTMAPGEDFPYGRVPGGRKYSWRAGGYQVNFYQYGDEVIWGMTARILGSELALLRRHPELADALREAAASGKGERWNENIR